MNFFFHILGGVGLFTIILILGGYFDHLTLNNLVEMFIGYSVCLAASIFPDIDNRNSVIFRTMNLILAIILFGWIIASYGFNINSLAIFIVVFCIWYFVASKIVIPRHRGFIHSIPTGVLFALFVWVGTNDMFLAGAAIVGFVSHLLLDRCVKLW